MSSLKYFKILRNLVSKEVIWHLEFEDESEADIALTPAQALDIATELQNAARECGVLEAAGN